MSGPVDIGARPVVIIGAGRSGTNLLRDVLTRLDGVVTWPCDEINYVWRHGHRERETDEFEVADADPCVSRFIRGRFAALVGTNSFGDVPAAERVVLEKTCANSLRVGFVDAVLPEARYLYLVRDGRDVIASAAERWKAPMDIGYLAAKARFVPVSDLPYYGSRYLLNRIARWRDPEARLALWGPRFEGWRRLSVEADLMSVCAAQWVRCVKLSDAGLARIAPERRLALRYEAFVADPVEQTASVVDFLGLSHDSEAIRAACRGVNTDSVGRGHGEEALDETILSTLRPTLQRHGYA